MEAAAILDDQAYRAALASAASLMGACRGTAAGERLELLVSLIEDYERQHFPMDERVLAAVLMPSAPAA